MTTDLCVTTKRPSVASIREHLSGSRRIVVRETPDKADFTSCLQWIKEAKVSHPNGLPASTDADFALVLHTSLKDLGDRQLLDPRLWEWLCLEPLQNYVRARWFSSPEADASDQQDSVLERLSCSGTLTGFSRNALARLFWPAHAVYRYSGGYSDVPILFANSDLYVGIFERKIGLHPMAAVELSKRLVTESETARRLVLKSLNFIFTTTSLEFLSKDDLLAEVDRILAVTS